MTETIIIIALIIAAWWSGLLPILLLAIGAALAAIGIAILTILEKVWRSNLLRHVRWYVRKWSGAEDRTVRRIMARRRPTPNGGDYEAYLREQREKNIRSRRNRR